VIVRAAAPADRAAIIAVHAAAFPTAAEARLVEALVADGDDLVSLVAETDAGIVGHVLFSRMTVYADGRALVATGLAPVGVLPQHQSTGIGSALIRCGLDLLDGQRVAICFVLGDNVFYGRFGLDACVARPFACRYAGPHFMARWLDGAVTITAGTAAYAAAFGSI
jgi:putative acetyltransferase